MAMKLLNTKEVVENGEEFIVDTYKSDITGKVSEVKYPKSSESSEIQEEPLTEMEQAIFDTALNTEYLVCIADMGY